MSNYRNKVGQSFAFNCPTNGTIATIWGTGTYADRSPVCSAAVHAGLINKEQGGQIIASIEKGQKHYKGSEQNGISSRSYHAYWLGSYRLSSVVKPGEANYSLSYDAAGNIIQKGELQLSYNNRNRLSSAQRGTMNAQYRYNAEGARSSKTVMDNTPITYTAAIVYLLGKTTKVGMKTSTSTA